MNNRETEFDEKLIRAFQEYLRYSDRWIRKGSNGAAVKARNYLLEIHKMTKQRRKEIFDQRAELKIQKQQAKQNPQDT